MRAPACGRLPIRMAPFITCQLYGTALKPKWNQPAVEKGLTAAACLAAQVFVSNSNGVGATQGGYVGLFTSFAGVVNLRNFVKPGLNRIAITTVNNKCQSRELGQLRFAKSALSHPDLTTCI